MTYKHRDEVEQQGFTIVPNPVSPAILDQISDEISEPASHRSRDGVRHAMHMAPVKKIASCPELIGIVWRVGTASISLSGDDLRQIKRRKLARGVAPGYGTAIAIPAGRAGMGTLVKERRHSLRTRAR